MITIDEFSKCEIKIGTIVSARFVEGADKLVCFEVDLGEFAGEEEGARRAILRQILSGVREYFEDIQSLVGKQVPVLTNLPTRTLRGLESQGMILYAVGEASHFTTLSPGKPVPNGTVVR